MKTKTLMVVIITILLTSCTSGAPTQAIEITNDVSTKVPFTEVAITQEPAATQEPPTKVPSQTPPSCVTLLTPANGAEIPAMGKVTFSWDLMNQAPFYVLSIVLPSGATVSFDMKQTFREQYMEAFSAGGQYRWRVILQDRKRNEICSSEFATFSKPASDLPQQPNNDDRKK